MKTTIALALLASLAQASPLGESSTKVQSYQFAEEKCAALGLGETDKALCVKQVGLLQLQWQKAREFAPKYCTDEEKATMAGTKVGPKHKDTCALLENKAKNGQQDVNKRLQEWQSKGSSPTSQQPSSNTSKEPKQPQTALEWTKAPAEFCQAKTGNDLEACKAKWWRCHKEFRTSGKSLDIVEINKCAQE